MFDFSSLGVYFSDQKPTQAALMIFVLDTAIGLGVWVPFTIGKTAALLSVCRFLLHW